MKKITPFLWFDTQAEEAMNFYCSIFKDSEVISVSRNGDDVMSVQFRLEDQAFMALNAGPIFQFTEAISMFVNCKDQAEVDYYWEKLLEGGEESQCGWLKDKFGLSWQIVPKQLIQLMNSPDRAAAGRAMQAMMKMTKIDVAALQRAHDNA